MKQELSLKDLERFAHTFWKIFPTERIFLFHGEMGAGKTTLIAALCHALGVQDVVGSPTFSIINEYADGNGNPVYHMDLYRLNSPEEAERAGVEDCLLSGHRCLVEWPEKAPRLFDDDAVHVRLSVQNEGLRLIAAGT